jgi:hypothetical protein
MALGTADIILLLVSLGGLALIGLALSTLLGPAPAAPAMDTAAAAARRLVRVAWELSVRDDSSTDRLALYVSTN